MAPYNGLSPLIWQSIPFGDPDSWLDFVGYHAIWHIELAKLTGTVYVATDDLKSELLRHSEMHAALDKALGVPPAYDLVSYDLADRQSFEGFMQTHGNLHQQERLAAGL